MRNRVLILLASVALLSQFLLSCLVPATMPTAAPTPIATPKARGYLRQRVLRIQEAITRNINQRTLYWKDSARKETILWTKF